MKTRRAWLLCLALIGVVLALLILATFSTLCCCGGESRAAHSQLNLVGRQIVMFQQDAGRLPESLLDLVHEPGVVAGGTGGPYLKEAALTDPWNGKFIYARLADGSGGFVLLSLGADGKPGGENDESDLVWVGSGM